jgi:hypothetical protein
VRGEEEHRQRAPAGVASYDPAQLEAAEQRHLHIQQEQIRWSRLHGIPEPMRIIDRGEPDPPRLQFQAEHGQDLRVVVQREDLHPGVAEPVQQVGGGRDHLGRWERFQQEAAAPEARDLHAVNELTRTAHHQDRDRR